MKQTYATAQIAKLIGVDKSTLLRWLYAGKLPEPKHQSFGGVDSRVWSETDLQRAKVYREQMYRKRSKKQRARQVTASPDER